VLIPRTELVDPAAEFGGLRWVDGRFDGLRLARLLDGWRSIRASGPCGSASR
jgi:hypothetical protein